MPARKITQHRDPMLHDLWFPHRQVLGNALDTTTLIATETDGTLAAYGDVIDMGPFDCLDILPLTTVSGPVTAAMVNIIGYEGAMPKKENPTTTQNQGDSTLNWMGISLARVDLSSPSADIGDLSTVFTEFTVLNNDVGFKAGVFTPAGTTTQLPIITSLNSAVTAYIGEVVILRARLRGMRKCRVLVTSITPSNATDIVKLFVRRFRAQDAPAT